MSTASVDIGFGLQVAIWGYAVTGNLPETSALIPEGHAGLVGGMGAWDKPPGADRGLVGKGDEPFRLAKEWSACPWIAEHSLRGHIDWPGL